LPEGGGKKLGKEGWGGGGGGREKVSIFPEGGECKGCSFS